MNKTAKIEMIISIILIVIFGSLLIYVSVTRSDDDDLIDTTVSALSDVNRFFTIDSAIAKYFSYVTSQDSDSLLKILDEDYIERNNITSSNIYDFVGSYDTNIKTSLIEAYQVSSYDNIYKYYVKVALKLETIYSSTLQEYTYYIITINENELTYAIEPIYESLYSSKIEEVIEDD